MNGYISLPEEVIYQHPNELKIYACMRYAAENGHNAILEQDFDDLASSMDLDLETLLIGIVILRLKGFLFVDSSNVLPEFLSELKLGQVSLQIVDRVFSLSDIIDNDPDFIVFVESCQASLPISGSLSARQALKRMRLSAGKLLQFYHDQLKHHLSC